MTPLMPEPASAIATVDGNHQPTDNNLVLVRVESPDSDFHAIPPRASFRRIYKDMMQQAFHVVWFRVVSYGSELGCTLHDPVARFCNESTAFGRFWSYSAVYSQGWARAVHRARPELGQRRGWSTPQEAVSRTLPVGNFLGRPGWWGLAGRNFGKSRS